MTNRSTLRHWVSLTLLVGAVLQGCSDRSAERTPADANAERRSGGSAVVCANSAIESLNPFTSPDQGAADLKPALFLTLVRYGTAGAYEPLLATDWQWQDERRGLRFRIRPDVTWHDGTPVTATDVAWTVRIAADPEYGYLSAGDFEQFRDAVVSDSLTVDLSFGSPFSADLEPFVALPILPRHLLAQLEPAQFQAADYHRAPVASGPFRLSERRSDGTLIFERYTGYPEALGRPYLDRLVRRTVPEASTSLAELESGSVDMCITSSSVADRVQGSRLQVRPFHPSLTHVLPLNTRRPPLDDVRVRRAVSAALQRSEIAAAISTVASPATGPIPAESPWYDPDIAQPDADSALAASLLEEAGWSRTDAIRTNDRGDELEFTLAAPQGTESIVTVVQAHLRRLGIGVDLRFMEWASYVGLIQDPERRPAAMFLGFVPEKIYNPAAELYSQFHSNGYSNLSSYSVAEVDSLLGVLVQATAEQQLSRGYREMQRRAAEDVAILYLVSDPRVIILGQRLQAVEADLNGPLASVTRWWVSAEQRR
jgi:ABC-type transport system substrate-binding protein